ncbi:Predicted methyltransferase [Ceraceosorus bombacis]|uniref:Predicted methyltransferase n=1 Tax=Ceraceosorus bombacis TaxID=401625 RepID=A0A0P1B8P9_9BASI|nr:Predicted methyltransferase [Ceraceosorus bombacis]
MQAKSSDSQSLGTKASPSLGEAHDWLSYMPRAIPGHVSADGQSSDPYRVQQQLPILLRIPPSTHAPLFAHRQWRSGLVMSDIIHSGILPLHGNRILELGAGTGLPSILCAAQPNVQRVVVTDYDEPTLLHRLKENVMSNPGIGNKIRVRGHAWGVNVDDLRDEMGRALSHSAAENDKADVILLADCLWDRFSHAPLLRTLTSLLSKDGNARIYIVSGLHTGREVLWSFMQAAHRLGLAVVPMPGADDWPSLSEWNEASIEGQGTAQHDAVAHVLELGLAFLDEEEESGHPLSVKDASSEAVEAERHPRTIKVHEPRLNGNRRKFRTRERDEEKKEVGGVKERNKWICAWAMGWR